MSGVPKLFFDWYEASIEGTPSYVTEILCQALQVGVLSDGKGMHGYDRRVRLGLFDARDRVADVLSYDSPDKADQVHVISSGVMCDRVAKVLRAYWAGHKVSRVDVSLDMLQAGAFDQVAGYALEVGKVCGVKSAPCIEDSLDMSAGRSQYIGSPKSTRQIIVYEKGKQLLGQGIEVDPLWVRMELTTRPQSKYKRHYAALTPMQIAAESPVMAKLIERFAARAGERIPYPTFHVNTSVESLAAMLMQYRRPLRTWLREECGGDAQVMVNRLLEAVESDVGTVGMMRLLTGAHLG